jgi:C2 domain
MDQQLVNERGCCDVNKRLGRNLAVKANQSPLPLLSCRRTGPQKLHSPSMARTESRGNGAVGDSNGRHGGPKEEQEEKQPPGGLSNTPVPNAEPGYTLRITFIRATNLPVADISSLSSDPFVYAEFKTSLPTRHKEDPILAFRTPTIRRNLNPEWNAAWVLANVPSSGFRMKARILDEDPVNHDDRLGSVHVYVDHVDESWAGIQEKAFKIRKHSGSKRAYLGRGCAVMFSKGAKMSGELILSVEVLERTKDKGGRVYTIGPNYWSKHYSPLIGKLTGTKEPEKDREGGVEKFKYSTIFYLI